MYLIVPSGVLTTIFNGYTNFDFKSRYWTIVNNKHLFHFKWENAIFDFTVDTAAKKSSLSITLDNIPKFYFNVFELRLDMDATTNKPELLVFKVSNTHNEFGEFTLYALEEKDIVKK